MGHFDILPFVNYATILMVLIPQDACADVARCLVRVVDRRQLERAARGRLNSARAGVLSIVAAVTPVSMETGFAPSPRVLRVDARRGTCLHDPPSLEAVCAPDSADIITLPASGPCGVPQLLVRDLS